MTDVQQQQLWSAVRTLLGVVAGFLVGKGLVDSTTAETVIGAVMTIVPLAWGYWSHQQDEAKTQAREAVAVQAGAAAQAAGVIVPPSPPPPATPQEIIKAYAPAAPAAAPKTLPFGVAPKP